MLKEIHTFRGVFCAAVLSGGLAGTPFAAAQAIAPHALQNSAMRIGRQAPNAPVSGTVWLQLQHKDELDAAVKAMYTKGSSSYHKFAQASALAHFAPTAAQLTAVQKELAAHNLSVTGVDRQGFAVHFTGQTSDVETAFHTTVEQYRTARGQTTLGLAAAPRLTGQAAGMVSAVTGLVNSKMLPQYATPKDLATGKQIGVHPVTTGKNPQGAYYSADCFYDPATTGIFTPGAAVPDGLYFGLQYGAPLSNTTRGTINPCAYSPQDFSKLSGLNTAWNLGYLGQGQTIAIVDAWGSPTIQNDLATFDSIYGLPAPKLTIHQTTPFTTTNAGWAVETTLDVEWSHAVAPDAKILLVETPTNYDSDLQSGVMYVIENKLANIISNSYALGEQESDLYGLTSWDEICELGAYLGVSVNFATGDNGDYYAQEKLGVTDVASPADSPYATAVGGTSEGFSPMGGAPVETGWGTNVTLLGGPKGPSLPPVNYGFQFGSGGGESQVFQKPVYQSTLSGSGRMLPDVSALADPYTGVEIVISLTFNGQTGQYFEVLGGTSLATPVFSAEWSLLEQAAGQDLGQAAPLIALGATEGFGISDVLPPPDQYSTYGATVSSSYAVSTYSPSQLILPQSTSPFLGTIDTSYGGYYYDLSFGTDSSLPVTTGWDPVTGWGTLNLTSIFDYVKQLQ